LQDFSSSSKQQQHSEERSDDLDTSFVQGGSSDGNSSGFGGKGDKVGVMGGPVMELADAKVDGPDGMISPNLSQEPPATQDHAEPQQFDDNSVVSDQPLPVWPPRDDVIKFTLKKR
jgi:hypothetical protein